MSFAAVQTTFYLKCGQLTWKKNQFQKQFFWKDKYKKMFKDKKV